MKILVQKLQPNAITPNKAHDTDSGFDLYSVSNYSLEPGDIKLISTGIAIELKFDNNSQYLPDIQIRSRSGLAIKNGIFVLNSPGTIDLDYRGEIKVILANLGKETFIVNEGDRIAQLIVGMQYRVSNTDMIECSELTTTVRGEGGFGSTGI